MTASPETQVALARELTAVAGYPMRDRYGFAASHETVLAVVACVFANPDDDTAANAIGAANAVGQVELASDYDTPIDEDYELGIVKALRPLAEDRNTGAHRAGLASAETLRENRS